MPLNLRKAFKFVLLVIVYLILTGSPAFSQKSKNVPPLPTTPLIKRTATRNEARRFGYGGTFTIIGAPRGSITIEGWSRSEVAVSAEIEVQAPSEEDLERLSAVNGFAFVEDTNHLSVLTTGTHDKVYMRRTAKDFPKRLLALPWKIDYRVRVPTAADLEINAGDGAIKLSGVEGTIRLSGRQTDATLALSGGTVSATIAQGTVNVNVLGQSWRGSGAEIQLAVGELNVELPGGFNADVDADILRSGKIDNSYPGLELRERPGLTERTIRARAGAGGAFLKFVVADGTITIRKRSEGK